MRLTMLPKVVVFLACLCVVKAGVLTVNTYGDQYDGIESAYDGADTLDRSVRNCVNTQCNSICRTLGFAGGVCITPTVCRCSGRAAQDAPLEEVNQEIDQDPEEVVVRTTRSCGAAECNAFCRKLGYARGVCIGTYCQCRSRLASNVTQPEIENPSSDNDPRSAFLDAIRPEEDTPSDEAMLESSARRCVNSQCQSACRRRGFARGVCVGINVCRCSGRLFRATEETDDVDQEIEMGFDGADTLDRSVRNCDNSQCNSICRALGFAQGVCISPTVCRCSGRRSADMSNEEATHDEIYQEIASVNDDAETLDRSVRNCVNSQCNSICRALGFAQGVCISSTVCRCSGRRSLVATNDEPATNDEVYQEIASVNDGADTLDRSVRNCDNSQCNSICRALGFAQGVCISPTVCRCSGRHSADISNEEASHEDIYQEIASVYDGADTLDRSVRNCVNSQCNSICRALGFAQGVCMSPTVCHCSGRRSADISNEKATHDDIYQDITNVNDDAETLDRSVRNCVNSQCNSICRALGFAQGVCISSTVCRCSGRRSLVATNDEPATYDEVYQEIASVNDGADTLDRSVRNCDNSQCNSICRALGFAQGVCISPTVCRCSGRRSADISNEEASHEDIYQEIASVNDGADTLDRSVRNCDNSQCNSICRALGFAQGVCISPTVCRCSGRRSADMSNEESTHDEIYQEIASVNDDAETLDRSVRNCVNSQCNSICRALGFAQGVCISSTVCRCSGRQSLVATNDEPATYDEVYQEIASVNDGADTLDRSVRNCDNSQCNSICRALGFAQGVCISPTVCRCSGRHSADISNEEASHEDIYQEIASVNDGADTLDRSVRNCVNSQCNSICRALGFAQGYCDSPTVCRCIGRLASDATLEANIIKDETPAIKEEADQKADCNLRWCEQTCRRMGFPGGACVNGRCKCDFQRSPPQLDNDVAANETANGDVKPAVEEEGNDIPQN